MRDLLSVTSSLYNNPLLVPWDAAIFGSSGDDVPLCIPHTDILEIVQGTKWLSLSIVQLWTLYLANMNVGTMDESLYGYFDPQSIQNMKQRGEEISRYILRRMIESKKQIYLGAYHDKHHWQLVVIMPTSGTIYMVLFIT